MITFDLHKTFKQNKEVVISLNASFNEDEIVAIHGASGAGKSTLLGMLSGLIEPHEGELKVGNEKWFDAKAGVNKRVNQRDIGYVFQDYALFPNMTVLQNIKYGMKQKDEHAFLEKVIAITAIADFLESKPSMLSGGQQQRVALARALLRKPKVLLLDEPFSAQDAKTREQLQREIKSIRQHLACTIIFVTHDLQEVFKVADHVWIIANGKFVQSGAPNEVFGTDKTAKKGKVLSTESKNGSTYMKIQVDGEVLEIQLPEQQH